MMRLARWVVLAFGLLLPRLLLAYPVPPPPLFLGTLPTQAAPGCAYQPSSVGCTSFNKLIGLNAYNAGSYGAICDGSSHTLASITSTFIGGVQTSTSGWSLSQWQTYYPNATATTNQIDGLAMTAAAAAARTAPTVSGQQPIEVDLPTGHCRADRSINFSGFSGLGVKFVGHGTIIYCTAAGQICVDMFATFETAISDVSIQGDATNIPAFGIADGRVSLAGTATDNSILRVNVGGAFSSCAVLIANSEVTKLDKSYISNSGAGHGICADGISYWGNSSTNISLYQTFTVASGQLQSFNDLTISDTDVRASGGGAPYWIAHLHHSHISSYIDQNNATPGHGVIDYEVTGGGSIDNWFSLHMELSPNLQDAFYITGTATAVTFKGFVEDDHNNSTAGPFFSVDTGSSIASVTMTDVDLHIEGFVAGCTAQLFGQPALWTVQGKIYLPALCNWAAPAISRVSLYTATQDFPFVPMKAMNRNPDFILDQPYEHATTSNNLGNGAIITDGWYVDGLGSGYASYFKHISTNSNAPPGTNYDLMTTVQQAAAYGSTTAYAIRSMIEASDTNVLNWGGAGAQPIVIDFFANTSVAGTYCGFVQNNGAAYSYVYQFTTSAANTWQEFQVTIPGATAGTWNTQANNVGLLFGYTMSAGASFQTTVNTWGAANYLSTSACAATAFASTVSATLSLSNIHVYFTPVMPQYQIRSFADEYAKDERYYWKSFPVCLKPQSNSIALTCGSYSFATSTGVPLRLTAAYASGLLASTYVSYPNPQFIQNQGLLPTVTTYTLGAALAGAVTTTITNSSASITTSTQSFSANQAGVFSATVGTTGGQVVAGVPYYILSTGLTSTTMQVSATPGGTAITFNAGGSPSFTPVANCWNETQSRASGAATVSDISGYGFLLSCALISGDAANDKLTAPATSDSGI